jgi:hypothetical protein
MQADAQVKDESKSKPVYSLNPKQAIAKLPVPPVTKHKVMILGSPHFDLGNNASDWKPKTELDMLSSVKQKEIEQVVQLVQKFKPTKICIEWMPDQDSAFLKRYRDYLGGKFTLKTGEYYQLGFRLAKMMGHEKLYCIDNRPKQPESLLEIDDWDKYIVEATERSDKGKYDALNEKFNNYLDSVKYFMPLKDYLLFLNSDEVKKETKRLWFTGLVHVGNKSTYAGADLTSNWYQRNIRIFSNVKKLCSQPEERILIIYGYGHAFVLEEAFKASKEFEVVPLRNILK